MENLLLVLAIEDSTQKDVIFLITFTMKLCHIEFLKLTKKTYTIKLKIDRSKTPVIRFTIEVMKVRRNNT